MNRREDRSRTLPLPAEYSRSAVPRLPVGSAANAKALSDEFALPISSSDSQADRKSWNLLPQTLEASTLTLLPNANTRPANFPLPALLSTVETARHAFVPKALRSSARPRVRSASETRVIALALQRVPLPEQTKRDLEARWRVGPDTVRKVLRARGVDPGPEKHLTVPLTDVLLCEGMADPLTAWVLASENERKILQADLLILDEWREQGAPQAKFDKSGNYRRFQDGRASSIRIGHQHRFRRDIVAAEDWLAERRRLEVR
jgi:hypothetical protein